MIDEQGGTRRLRALLAIALAAALASAAPGAVGGPVRPLAAASAAECNGDECQGPPPAPEEVTPGTATAEGPENPPARFPAQGNRKHRHGRHGGKRHQKRPRHRSGR